MCRSSFTMQCLGIMGGSQKLILVFQSWDEVEYPECPGALGLLLQELRFKEARWALSSCEWAVCDFRRVMRT